MSGRTFQAFAAFIIFCSSPLFAQSSTSTVRTGAPPAWVEWIDGPASIDTKQTEESGGQVVRLMDRQIHPQQDEDYFHVIKEIVSEAGVRAGANLEFTWDPSFQTLVLHQITVRRGAERMDRLEPTRAVHPCRVAYVNNLWTLFAFDPKADGIRKFVFFRIAGLELTDERFPSGQQLDLNKELEGSMGVYKGSEKHEVVIEFDAWGADDVRGRTWHASQVLKEDPSTGELTVRMTLNNLEEIERWVLGFGEHAEVVKPAELKERVEKTARMVTAKYAKHTKS